jgi:aspartate/methionine/tyrosine aminotransferase
MVRPGAKPNLSFMAPALIELGDEVLYPYPCFPTDMARLSVVEDIRVPAPHNGVNDFSFFICQYQRNYLMGIGTCA